ncbi:MAG TPA: YXWGXW repeat-containing protein [Terriglobales bacterium]|nr:YXWGXW repeat-containing protein [Terriglobales bacterium]
MRKIYFIVVLALLSGLTLSIPPTAQAQVSVGLSVRIGPPPLRVVAVQPMCPGPGYIWTPGYWSYRPGGYYWVDGRWVMAPAPGMLWTPGYWGFRDGLYVWHAGYWGPHVGFYGGINYGFGYFGTGFVGGHWAGGRFFYNTAVWRVNEREVHNTYIDRTVIREDRGERPSFNGGRGVNARESAAERNYGQERHLEATPEQSRHESEARVAGREGRGRGNDKGNSHGDKHDKGDRRGGGGL